MTAKDFTTIDIDAFFSMFDPPTDETLDSYHPHKQEDSVSHCESFF